MNIVKKFNSVTDYMRYLDNGEVQKGFRDAGKEGSAGWTGTKDYETSMKLLAYGDKEMLDKVNQAGVSDARAKVAVMQKRKTFCASVVGAIPHIPNFVAGTPNSMIAVREVKTKKRVINLFYNAAFDSSVGTDAIINVAANVMSAIILIEASGVHVNLYAGCISRKDRQLVSAIVKLKDSGQRLDVLKLCYPMINPSWTRRQFIRYIDITPNVKEGFAVGHGSPETSKDDKFKVLSDAKIQATILNYYDLVGKSTDDIIKYVKEQNK